MDKQSVNMQANAINPPTQKRPRTLSEIMQARQKEKAQSHNPKIDSEPEYKKKEKSLNYVVRDGFFTSIKSGFTESFVMPFAIALGASTGMLSILASVPQLIAAFFQLFAQESLKFFKTRGKLIFWTALIQAFMWLPLLLVPFLARDHIWLVLLIVTIEATLGTFQGPIYNSILGDNIDEAKRGEFFGKRNRVVNLISFVSTLAAGFILAYFKDLDVGGAAHYVFIGFAILFGIAFIARLTAAYYKSKIYDPPFTPKEHNTSFFRFLKNMTHNNYGIFVLYVFFFRFAASISLPFFALYLLKDMQLSYTYFTIIMAASIAASFLSMTFWGRLIDKHGSKRVLTIAGFLIPLCPLLLIGAIFLHDPMHIFLYLLIEEIFSGMMWAAFNLSTSSFLFDATSKDERIKHIAYYNFLVGIAVFLGALLGGYLIKIYPIWAVSAIPFIFLTTGVLRFLSTVIFIRKVREARMVEIHIPGRSFFHRVVSVPPHYGSNIDIMGTHHVQPKNYLEPKKKDREKRPPIDPVKKEEKKTYEKKSFEYYKENALKTGSQKERVMTPADDSDKIEKKLEQDKAQISEIVDKIKKEEITKR